MAFKDLTDVEDSKKSKRKGPKVAPTYKTTATAPTSMTKVASSARQSSKQGQSARERSSTRVGPAAGTRGSKKRRFDDEEYVEGQD